MFCPHCQHELKLAPNNAFRNAEIYGTTNKVYTLCCNKLVTISRVISFKVNKSSETPDQDDWGNKQKIK